MSSDNFNEWPATDRPYLSTILAAAVFNSLLQGILVVATYRYFSLVSTSRDGLGLRIFVGVVMGLVLLHTSLAAAKVYYVTIARIYWKESWVFISDTTQKMFILLTGLTSIQLCPFEITINGTTCLLSQFFFAYRCWRVTHKAKSVAITLAIGLATVAIGAVGIIGISWISYAVQKTYTGPLQYLIYIWGVSSLLFEVCVVFLLFRFLWSSRTGIRGLDRVILRLLAVSLESSLPCLVFLILTMVTVLLRDVTSNFFAFSTASLYGLSLMVALNCRDKVQTRLSEFRNQAAFLNFSNNNANGAAESLMISDEALEMRRESAANGIDPYKRPSIVTFVKDVVLSSPPPARLAV